MSTRCLVLGLPNATRPIRCEHNILPHLTLELEKSMEELKTKYDNTLEESS